MTEEMELHFNFRFSGRLDRSYGNRFASLVLSTPDDVFFVPHLYDPNIPAVSYLEPGSTEPEPAELQELHAADQSNEDTKVKKEERLSAEEPGPDEPKPASFVVHIDILKDGKDSLRDKLLRGKVPADIHLTDSSVAATKLNQFMIRMGYYDPRTQSQPPTLAFRANATLKALRQHCNMSDGRYEFWTVRDDFSLTKLRDWLSCTGVVRGVQVTEIIDNVPYCWLICPGWNYAAVDPAQPDDDE